MKFKKGDKVSLPFGEVGIIVKVRDNIWGHNYDAKIVEATLNTVGDVIDYKKEQMELIQNDHE
jgi:hypothetical protein